MILPTFKSCTRQAARRDSSYARAAWSKFAPPIARFRYPCGLSTEPAAEAIRR